MKLQVPFVQLPLRFDADRLAAEMHALGDPAWRPHPQKYPGNFALPLISVGGDPDSDAIAGPMRPTPYLEQCPYLTQVLARLGAVWGRTRLMKLVGGAEVTPHADINYYWRDRMRVHVPIQTQPGGGRLGGSAPNYPWRAIPFRHRAAKNGACASRTWSARSRRLPRPPSARGAWRTATSRR